MSPGRFLFLLLLAALAGQRIAELRLSKAHETAIRRAGGQEYGAAQYRLIQALHAGWFAATAIEVLGWQRPFRRWLAAVAVPFFLLGQSLRYAAIRTLGPRWTTRVMTIPGPPPVTGGIYRYLRHPNYLGVVLELAAFPLIYSAYWTALIFSLFNLLLLRARILLEEQALADDNDYLRFLGDRPRFRPRRGVE
ncbi:MAG: isoprenylcysteine carboxyl methyltransferase [Chloroflexi bacterium]|nr:isoprenylcysteine carboxyl methyltransferase [Chloroflexota bacterium]MCI0576918.1 isoprenylcysteine carboxyl methyltransferase [Chloroflexota bacterium]MCI0649694.1 isoprenylcysteine carboxyl methyltransferase [Chloroflexota bacterium]MCI0729943.1 isoprenylcysteine carboxyl methyltransferase [Chloroflexota bacterium]